jgi:hypothetical protein
MNSISIRGKLNRIYWWLERRIDARTKSSQYLYADTLRSCLHLGDSWLDMGCGRQVLPDWVPGQASLLSMTKLTVGMDATPESFKGNQQISNLVEHLEKPLIALREIYRILQPGGYFIYHTPNSKFYITFLASLLPQFVKNKVIRLAEGRSEEDVFPTRYRMNSLKAIYETAAGAGFRVAECHAVNTSSTSDMIFGPFVILTLSIRRLLQWKRLTQFRSNFVVVLEKPLTG